MIIEATSYTLEDTPWTTRAACLGMDQNIFFPERGGSTAQARAICASCPVRTPCLEYAVRWRINQGVWGGLSPGNRERYYATIPKPRRLPPVCGTLYKYKTGCRCERCVACQMLHFANYPGRTH